MIAPLLVGVIFGWLLDRGGLTRHARIVGVFRLTDLALMKFLGSAIVVGALVVQAAQSLGFVGGVPVTPTRLLAQAAGGALFGVAMSLTGFCPGTIVAGAATGRLDALVPGTLGLFLGALIYGPIERWLAPLTVAGSLGAQTFSSLLGASPWLLLALLGELAFLGFYLVERRSPEPRVRAEHVRPAAPAHLRHQH